MSSILSGSELLTIQKEMKEACDIFFYQLEKAQLITEKPVKEFDPGSFLNWLNRDDLLIANGKIELVKNMNSIISVDFPEEDFLKFLIALSVYQFVIRLEQLKDIFMNCLNLEKLDVSKDTTLGGVVWSINNKLYPLAQTPEDKQDEIKEKRKSNEKLFFIEFRNAIIHKKYVIGSKTITYVNNNGDEFKITSKDFAKMSEQFDYLRNYIYNYRDNLIKKYQ